MSDCRVLSQHRSSVMMLVVGATRPTLDKGAVLMQLCNQWLYGAQNIGWRSSKLQILTFGNFCAPIKVAPMARALPSILSIQHCFWLQEIHLLPPSRPFLILFIFFTANCSFYWLIALTAVKLPEKALNFLLQCSASVYSWLSAFGIFRLFRSYRLSIIVWFIHAS